MLAGLGSLVCAWLTSQRGYALHLRLAGRTGRAALGTSAWLQRATAAVHMQRCDVASTSEAQLLCTRRHAGPLSALIHAGRHHFMNARWLIVHNSGIFVHVQRRPQLKCQPTTK